MPPITHKHPLENLAAHGSAISNSELRSTNGYWSTSLVVPESIPIKSIDYPYIDEVFCDRVEASRRYGPRAYFGDHITLREYMMWKRLKQMERVANHYEEMALRNSVLSSRQQIMSNLIGSESLDSIHNADNRFDSAGFTSIAHVEPCKIHRGASSLDGLNGNIDQVHSVLKNHQEEANAEAIEAIAAFKAKKDSKKSLLASSVHHQDNDNLHPQLRNIPVAFHSPYYYGTEPPKVAFAQAWEDMTDRLRKFKKEYGHCLVPWNYGKDRKLGSWVSKQRHYYSNGSLSQERIETLEALGFVWEANKQTWNKMFERLVEYQKKHGDCLVPTHYKKDPKLGRWVYMQRTRKCKIERDQVTLLESIGFKWSVHKAFWKKPKEINQK